MLIEQSFVIYNRRSGIFKESLIKPFSPKMKAEIEEINRKNV